MHKCTHSHMHTHTLEFVALMQVLTNHQLLHPQEKSTTELLHKTYSCSSDYVSSVFLMLANKYVCLYANVQYVHIGLLTHPN